jgi:hypothetical protein
MADYEIELDERVAEPDVLYLTLEGRLEREQAIAAVEEMESLLAGVDEGFYMINDISAFNPISQDAVDAIDRGKQVIAEHGVAAVVRVVGDSTTAKMQFDQVGDDSAYRRATAESVSEAEAALEDLGT